MEADLIRFFPGVTLSGMRAGMIPVLTVANCAAHLPRGGAVGEWVGGAMAITAETEALWEIAHITAQVNSKKKLKPRPMPEGVREQQRKLERRAEQMRRWRAKHGGGSRG